ncbi:hypothetical protein BZA05DRAFT_352463 [Tricharina praecox]|uniref:uncharacterized protein n=1 Tax=Tricharina praecox TaxID=43433 RepID=UPI002221104E|nr:uncharacterized protein BZA05DRAFT_352463 [Tricharina praecox]KAI5853421.1 hypothetical protein BZA05DRAFT_352463 [Tricharina praecox]
MEMQNANPTILSIADLPTRKPAASARPKRAHAFLPPTYAADPFAATSDLVADEGTDESEDDDEADGIDAQEIYDLVATMCDPEHPITLGELAVVNLEHISVRDNTDELTANVTLEFTPTITHCHLATVIGLGLVVRLQQALPPRFRIDVRCKEGTHTTDKQLNKQLADKERVMSALENETLMGLVGKMIETCK